MNNTHLRVLLALVCVPPLAACNVAKRGAQAAVLERLVDPDSAKFGDFYYNSGTKKGCLTVNSKNSLGGYTGNEQAYVERRDDKWVVIGIADISPESCKQIHAEQPSEGGGAFGNAG